MPTSPPPHLRVLIQHPHHGDEISGVLTYVNALAESLRSDFGHTVELISSKQANRRERFDAVRRSDLVHANSNDLWTILVARLLRRRVVLKLHFTTYQTVHFEYTPMTFPARIRAEVSHLWRRYGRTQNRIFAEATARLFLRMFAIFAADRVLACSEFLAASTALGDRVTPVYNPATLPKDGSATAEARIPFFVFAGRLSNEKGCDLLIDAIRLMPRSSREFQVLIVGDGEERRALEETCRANELTHVTFLGHVPHSETTNLMRGALALVIPSRCQEAAGYTPVEASLVATPTISARAGGLPETAGPDALYFERESASELATHLLFALDHQAEMRERGLRALSFALDTFSPRTTTEAFLDAVLVDS